MCASVYVKLYLDSKCIPMSIKNTSLIQNTSAQRLNTAISLVYNAIILYTRETCVYLCRAAQHVGRWCWCFATSVYTCNCLVCYFSTQLKHDTLVGYSFRISYCIIVSMTFMFCTFYLFYLIDFLGHLFYIYPDLWLSCEFFIFLWSVTSTLLII